MSFVEAIDVSTPCILARGRPSKSGHYRKSFKNRVYYAHRLAWLLTYGELPEKDLHHICENKRCINVKHLKPLSRGEHMKSHGVRGIAAIHAEAKRCKFGHEFDGHDGRQRTCSTCSKRIKRAWYEAHKLEVQNGIC